MISVLILTYNESSELPACLSCLDWCNDIVVYDSYSTDSTKNIVLASGARFIQRPGQDTTSAFGGDEAFHRTWGLRQITFSNPWLLVLDADERVGPLAIQRMFSAIGSLLSSAAQPTNPVAFRLRRDDYFQGRHLKHVQATSWYIRLFRPEFVHYQRLVNPVTVVNGPVSSLDARIEHYPFSKGLSHWISRHNTYSSFEAREVISASSGLCPWDLLPALFSPHIHIRRAHQKKLFMCLPFRPLIKFILLYFLKRGFLDGGAGFTYALLQSIYEYFIVLKVRELKR